MRTALAVIAAIVLIALGLVFLFFMVNVTGLPLCSEFAPGADECIDGTSAGRVAGLDHRLGGDAMHSAGNIAGPPLGYGEAGRRGVRDHRPRGAAPGPCHRLPDPGRVLTLALASDPRRRLGPWPLR